MDRKINILFVSHFPHSRMGGQQSMLGIIRHLDRSKFNPLAIVPEPGDLSVLLKSIGCPVYYIPILSIKPRFYFRIITNYFKLKKLIIDKKIDIIHCDEEHDAYICGFAREATPAKLLWHIRVSFINKKDRINEKKADYIIGVSESIKRKLSDNQFILKKYQTVFDGVDCSVFKPAEDKLILRKLLDIPLDKFILTFVGVISKEKGIFDLVNALKIIKINVKPENVPLLLIIGSPSNNSEFEKLNQLILENDLENSIRFISHTDKIYEWMQASDAVILPSYSEGLPRVLIEAMACGTLIIGSDIPGIREIISKETGFIVSTGSPADISEKIIKLINDVGLLDKFKIKCRKEALLRFDIIMHTRIIEDIYINMMK
jgi:glycosyltransferase involved in cell wall biosynthesis